MLGDSPRETRGAWKNAKYGALLGVATRLASRATRCDSLQQQRKLESPHLPWTESLARLSNTHGRSQPDHRLRSRKTPIKPFLGVARRLASRATVTATRLQNSATQSPSTAEIATRKMLSTTLGDSSSRPRGGQEKC